MNINRKYSNCFNKQESSSEKELSALIEYESRRGKFSLSRYDKYFEYSYVFEENDKWRDTQAQRPAIHKSSGSQASVPACPVWRKNTLQKTGFYNGGTLPHYDIKYAFQFITIREYG